MRYHMWGFAAATLFLLTLDSSRVSAEAIAVFDESSPNHGEVGAFAGGVTATAESLIFNVGANPDFGGLTGASYTIMAPMVDFDPAAYQWEWRFRILPGNNVQHMAAGYSDYDESVFSEETRAFDFDISALTPADGWVTLRQSLATPYFMSGFGDGVPNPDLGAIAITAGNVNADRFHIEMDYLRIVPVPEPSCAMLCLIGSYGWLMVSARSRNAGR
jgi:hypothetical protein